MDEWCFRSLLEFKEIVGKKKDWVGTKFWVNTNFGSQKFVSQNVLKKGRDGFVGLRESCIANLFKNCGGGGGGVVVQNSLGVQLQSRGTTRLKLRVFSFETHLISSQVFSFPQEIGLHGGVVR